MYHDKYKYKNFVYRIAYQNRYDYAGVPTFRFVEASSVEHALILAGHTYEVGAAYKQPVFEITIDKGVEEEDHV